MICDPVLIVTLEQTAAAKVFPTQIGFIGEQPKQRGLVQAAMREKKGSHKYAGSSAIY